MRPEVVQLQRRGGSELDVERSGGCACVAALRAVGASGAEVVLHPISCAPGLREGLHEDVVLPHFQRRARARPHVGVELGVDLDAVPGVVVGGEGVPARERVAPVEAPAVGTAVHLHPVVVEVKPRVGTADAPDGFEGEGDPVVSVGLFAGVRVGVRVVVDVAAEPNAAVVPRCARLVLDVPAHEVFVVTGQQQLVQIRRAGGASRAEPAESPQAANERGPALIRKRVVNIVRQVFTEPPRRGRR